MDYVEYLLKGVREEVYQQISSKGINLLLLQI